ncbi:hypothetical protein [Kitasatospora sp. NPDC058190]|uniref:hypothetical protein n=1 Tax=Kitasatospora sp. NPDC058190 TaxID=3346371 RepID=UPI0036DD8A39
MAEGMDEWARGAEGRTVTWPAPDTFVLVEGVLLRMLPEAPATPSGTEVVVGLDETNSRLVARPAGRNGAERG